MKKILNVTYTPRVNSNTFKLNEIAINIAKENFIIEELDLVKNPPELLIGPNLNAYYSRTYLGKELNQDENTALSGMTKAAEQLKNADILILAYPIYNFGMPGVVKSWIDLIVQERTAFTETSFGPEGHYQDKKALIINTSGGMKKDSPSDFSTPHIKRIMTFMGMKIENVKVEGAFGIKYTGLTDEFKDNFREEVKKILDSWK